MIAIKKITKTYKTGEFFQKALNNVSIEFKDSEFVAILGASGSGKTTLLNILGGLDSADEGEIFINGKSTLEYKSADWDAYRNHEIGFVFQSYNLIPHQNILSNVEIALTIAGVSKEERREAAIEALEKVGLKEHIYKKPNQLSGGQMQRVAIARALVNNPTVLLADEPTGALDSDTGIQVMEYLKKISKERLVIMVTHNDELADRYATRIVKLKDGRIVEDQEVSRKIEYEEKASKNVSEEKYKSVRKNKASMSFKTALSLSFSNLMSKKMRTFLTAFAGSIGIIGIATILALSTGVNNYIAKVEKDMLSTYPLSITKTAADISQFFDNADEEDEKQTNSKSKSNNEEIMQKKQVDKVFSNIHENDLASLKTYIEKKSSNIKKHATLVSYDYGIEPYIYKSDISGRLTRLTNPMNDNKPVFANSIGIKTQENSFRKMLENIELLKMQYDVLKGRWPSKYDEAVLILDKNGKISDFTLYNIGFYDIHKLRKFMEKFRKSIVEKNKLTGEHEKFTYSKAINMKFKVMPAAKYYTFDKNSRIWIKRAANSEYIRRELKSSLELKIVGIIKPNPQTDTPAMAEGVAYMPSLTKKLIGDAGKYTIVREQIKNPDVDVFTGKTFKELSEKGASLDMSKIFEIDTEMLKRAFSFDSSQVKSMLPDTNKLFRNINSASIFRSAGFSKEIRKLSAGIQSDISKLPMYISRKGIGLSLRQQREVRGKINKMTTRLLVKYMSFFAEQIKKDPKPDNDEILRRFLARRDIQSIIAKEMPGFFNTLANAEVQKKLEKTILEYLRKSFSKRLSESSSKIVKKISNVFAREIGKAMKKSGARFDDESFRKAIGKGLDIDKEVMGSAFKLKVSQEELGILIASYLDSREQNYESNLNKLGYANMNKPSAINIYPNGFAGKEKIKEEIEIYNKRVKSSENPEKEIIYTDIMGIITGSVTDIVNMISYVLIAFVSVSLIVSSIMIGIITYISVVERRKEIGILRAMGASRFNIANIFNAETIIEGLMSGIFAVMFVLLMSLPVNAVVLDKYNVENILSLSFSASLTLIVISVVLTLFAGFIPSGKASRKDPVEALRSE